MAQTGIGFYRKRKKLRQIDVATAIGTTESRMSRIEVGQEIPTAGEVDKIVALLEVPPSYLFSNHVLNEVAERSRAEAAS